MKDWSAYLNQLPIMPEVAAKVLKLADSRLMSFTSLEETILQDPGITARILKIANSAQFARQHQISQVRTAITLLGLNTIKNLVILLAGSGLFGKAPPTPFYRHYWSHSLFTAFTARDLCLFLGYRDHADSAFVGGLLHDIGQIPLYLSDPTGYRQLVETAVTKLTRLSYEEDSALNVNHHEVGAKVLQSWGFPQFLIDTALEHGNPQITSQHKLIISALTMADFLNSQRYQKNPQDFSSMATHFGFLGLNPARLTTFHKAQEERLLEDRLYQECRVMLKLT